jgi:hypothetical protein
LRTFGENPLDARLTHVPVKLGQRDGNTDLGQMEDGLKTSQGFPPEARAVPTVHCQKGKYFGNAKKAEQICNAAPMAPGIQVLGVKNLT